MTNEEAAEILKLYKQRLDESCSNLLDRDKAAFDLAIKALEEVEGLPENLHREREQAYMNGYADGKERPTSKMTKRPRKSNRKPKCPNSYNCGDCIHAQGVWEGLAFRGIRCLKGCK